MPLFVVWLKYELLTFFIINMNANIVHTFWITLHFIELITLTENNNASYLTHVTDLWVIHTTRTPRNEVTVWCQVAVNSTDSCLLFWILMHSISIYEVMLKIKWYLKLHFLNFVQVFEIFSHCGSAKISARVDVVQDSPRTGLGINVKTKNLLSQSYWVIERINLASTTRDEVPSITRMIKEIRLRKLNVCDRADDASGSTQGELLCVNLRYLDHRAFVFGVNRYMSGVNVAPTYSVRTRERAAYRLPLMYSNEISYKQKGGPPPK